MKFHILKTRSHSATATLILLGLLLIVTGIAVHLYQGNNDIQISRIYGDDAFIAHTLVLENPDIYKNDINAVTLAEANKLCLPTVIARVLYRYFDIHPKQLFPIYIVFYGLLLAFGSFFFTLSVIKNKYIALLCALFIIYSRLYAWNIAWFSYIQFYPYNGELALSFSLITAGLFIKRSWLWLIFFMLTGFTHPLQAIYLGAIFALATILELYQAKCYVFYKDNRILGVCVCSMLFLSPYLLQILENYSQFTEYNILFDTSILSNTHLTTWRTAPGSFFISLIVYLSILGISWYAKNIISKKNINFFYATITIGIIFPIIHIASTEMNWRFIAKLLLTRSSQLIILLLLPIAIYGIIKKLYMESGITQFLYSVLFIATFLMPSPYLIVLSLIGYVILYLQLQRSVKLSSAICLLLIAYIGINYVSVIRSHLSWLWLRHETEYLWLVALALGTCQVFKSKKILFGLLTLFLCFGLYKSSIKHGGQFVDPSQDEFAVQEWALMNTPKNSCFMLVGKTNFSWKSYSERPLFTIFGDISMGFYSFPLKAKEFLINELIFFSKEMNIPMDKLLSRNVTSLYSLIGPRMTKENYIHTAQKYNCMYLISQGEKPLYDFPIVYKNAKYIVQSLQ